MGIFDTTLVDVGPCCNCGTRIGLSPELFKLRKEDKKLFWCPNGHAQVFTAETEADKLRRERDRLKQEVAYKDDQIALVQRQRDGAKRQASALKGTLTKVRRRTAHGVCPCCTRSFANINRHMRAKHPRYVKEHSRG